MSKSLSEMSLRELWELFPIILSAHDDRWDSWYAEESGAVLRALSAAGKCRIHHIGSTAVRGIWAKPTIDMLVELGPGFAMERAEEILLASGWLCMAESRERMSFNKGYTESGFAERVFHLHLRHAGDADEVYFRDYLNGHPDVAKEYERLKLSLWKEYEHDRDGYTTRKTEFVKKYTELAKRESERRELDFIPVQASDPGAVSRLSAFASEIVKDCFDPLIGEAQNDYMIARFQSAESIASQIAHGCSYYFVCSDGRETGFIAFYPRGTEMYLSKFYLEKFSRGKGYSKEMLRFVTDAARKAELESVTLNVNRHNARAIAVYERLGFVKIREEKNDIGGCFAMDDFVMEYEFSSLSKS